MKSFAFIGGFGLQEIIVLIIVIAFWIGLLLAIRSLMLWYWKIDTVITLMKEQKEILRDIYIQQGGDRAKHLSDSLSEIERKAKLFDESQKK